MRIKPLALLLACVVSAWVTVVTAAAPLTVAQLLRLIAARTPDKIVAAEVTERGIREAIDKALIESARKNGAGPATLAALERIRPKSVLSIKGTPGTNIAIDGARIGRIADDGTLTVPDLWSGRHDIEADLFEHTPEKRTVLLQPNKTSDLELRLTSLFGLVSITANVASATIDIDGVSRFRNSVSRQKLRAGQYALKVEAPYWKTHTETLGVIGGDVIERQIVLAPDREQLDSLLGRMRTSFSARNFRSTASDATSYLGVALEADISGRTAALTMLASSQLQTGQYSEGVASGLKALGMGGTLSLDVVHHHGSGFVQPHRAMLTLSAYKLTYDPIESCTFGKGAVDMALVVVSSDRNLRLGVLAPRSQGGTAAVQIKLPKPNKPNESYTLNFIDDDVRRLDAVFLLLQGATARRKAAASRSTAVAPSAAIGKYIRVGQLVDYFELKADGTFHLLQAGKTYTGTYSIAGTVLTVQMAGKTDTGRFEGTRIIDANGDVWEKASQSPAGDEIGAQKH
jgi:hypothetical protein